MKLTSSLSRREKLLLGLLTSTLIFSASFSYGAVNQSKVDSIMQTINNAASNFSSQADRDTYYNRVYTGLSDAIDMLAVVRNNVGAMIGTPPVSVSPGNPGGNMGGETSTDALALCSSDTTVENLTWPSSNSLRMKISDTRSKVFKVVVPSTNSGTMYISYASSSKQGFRQPKLSYAVSQKKACAYTDSTLGYGNTLQGGGSMGLYVTSTAPTSPYTGTPKLSPGTWYISFKSAQPLTSTDDPEPLIELFLQGGSSTPPVNNPPVVVNPIANYPIPEPCPNNTRFMKELMGGPANGGWIRRYFDKSQNAVGGHVYRLRIDESDGKLGTVAWAEAPVDRWLTTVKVSPYPCDFVTKEEEKAYWESPYLGRATLKDAQWNSIKAATTFGACAGIANSNHVDYIIGSLFTNPNFLEPSNWSKKCALTAGVTYYVNVRPAFAQILTNGGNGCNGNYPCGYDLIDGGSQKQSTQRSSAWGEKYSQFDALVSSENIESLRQKVVSDYKTKGVNTDGLTNVALGGTAVTPPGGNPGSGPVVVREGPWERVEDIFCPDTKEKLQSEYGSFYNYYNQGNTYWNVKDYNKPADETLPTTCTTGKKFVKHGMQATCYVYECKN